jgi:diaminopimelate epimerase
MISFYKYQGTGNDFIMIEDKDLQFPASDQAFIHRLCDRRFGIGADGLILLQPDNSYDFKMVYFNADGKEGSMCGNGGRCVAAFAKAMGWVTAEGTQFRAYDGIHAAQYLENGKISLMMQDVKKVNPIGEDYVLDTGSPHYVKMVHDIERCEVVHEGKRIRYNDQYREEGINVNFVEMLNDTSFIMRTYERGVEDETLSCGTGTVASAIAMAWHRGLHGELHFSVEAPGGMLEVKMWGDEMAGSFTNIRLIGPAEMVFEGRI